MTRLIAKRCPHCGREWRGEGPYPAVKCPECSDAKPPRPPANAKSCPHCGNQWRGALSEILGTSMVSFTVCCGREVRS